MPCFWEALRHKNICDDTWIISSNFAEDPQRLLNLNRIKSKNKFLRWSFPIYGHVHGGAYCGVGWKQ